MVGGLSGNGRRFKREWSAVLVGMFGAPPPVLHELLQRGCAGTADPGCRSLHMLPLP